ncbi:fimbria/pilus outer membrane usher protein [Pleurocapsa sp. PCC 7319]|uniref:fimbria/pilus outer membrane usher protein n=1 Tax=Pleurocapsa sp. PCC 7319 TaxID=118161 RepID=UPI000378D3DC|nr:fimbria/pilus outer membrane usher protein [Pleurocapsa sp. PCC 7319]
MYKFYRVLLTGLIASLYVLINPKSVFAQNQHNSTKKSDDPDVQQIFVPFILNNQEKGQIILFLYPNNQISFPATSVIQQTKVLLLKEWQEKLVATVDQEGNLTLEAFQQIGIEAKFDQRKLELQIQIPPEKLQTSVIALSGERLPPEAEKALLPSDFSGWVNFRVIEDIYWSGNSSSSLGLQPIQIDFDSAMNYRGWVLENNFALTGSNWERYYTSLVKDNPQTSLRYVLGDFYLTTRGWQQGGELAGIAVAKNFSLQPYRNNIPIGKYEFLLKNQSQVDVIVNGILTRQLNLPAGRHDLRDFNLSTGINDIQLIIDDDLGNTETIEFLVPFDFATLAPGVNEFAYSFGFPVDQINGGRSYELDNPTLAVFHRSGITNNFTFGGYGQADLSNQLLGIEGIWATSIGNWQFDTAVSHATDLGIDYAVKLDYFYRSANQQDTSERELDLSLEYRGKNFIAPGEGDLSDRAGYDISANYRQKLLADLDVNLGFNYRLNTEESNAGNISLGLSKPLNNSMRGSLALQKKLIGDDEQDDFGVRLNLSWSPPLSSHSITSSTDTITDTNQIFWSSRSSYLSNGITTTAALFNSPTGKTFNGSLEYGHYLGKVELSQDLGLNDDDSTIENSSRLQLETALVFADGHFGITRPVRDSFALVVPHPNLKGQRIELNPFLGGFEGRVTSFSGGVVPNLQSYRVSDVWVEALDLPLGYDLGAPNYAILPTYKSGTLIKIGTDATVFIRGSLVDAKGEPVSLKVIEITSLDDPDWQPVTLFTNRVGKFAAEGFKPGRYQGSLLGKEKNSLEFTIPEEQTGLSDLGVLRLDF